MNNIDFINAILYTDIKYDVGMHALLPWVDMVVWAGMETYPYSNPNYDSTQYKYQSFSFNYKHKNTSYKLYEAFSSDMNILRTVSKMFTPLISCLRLLSSLFFS